LRIIIINHILICYGIIIAPKKRNFLWFSIEKPLNFHDLEDIDADKAKNLLWTLQNDVSELEITFSVDRITPLAEV